MGKILVYTESRIIETVEITLHYDDKTEMKTKITVGDEVAFRYLHNKELVDIQGVVLNIIPGRQTILKIDASGKYKAELVEICIDNIREFLDLNPGPDSGEVEIPSDKEDENKDPIDEENKDQTPSDEEEQTKEPIVDEENKDQTSSDNNPDEVIDNNEDPVETEVGN